MKFPVHIPPPRRADRTLLPAALTALLVLTLAVQLSRPSPVELPDAEVARPLRLSPLLVTPLVADPVIAERPLFAPGRRETPVAGVADKTAPLDAGRAVGIISVRGRVRVFIQAPDGKVTAVGPGGFYNGWRIDRIDGNTLQVSRGADRATLTVSASAAPVQPRTAAPEKPEEETQ